MILTCCAPGDGYQPLIGLQDIKKLQHLTEDAVRDILRSAYRDSDLKIVTMGQLTDMSGTNDAFNSSICSLEVSQALYQTCPIYHNLPKVTASMTSGDIKVSESQEANGSVPGSDGNQEAAEQNQKTFHFVIKSPPKASFIKAMHKLTKPFLNEVTWYIVSIDTEPSEGFQI